MNRPFQPLLRQQQVGNQETAEDKKEINAQVPVFKKPVTEEVVSERFSLEIEIGMENMNKEHGQERGEAPSIQVGEKYFSLFFLGHTMKISARIVNNRGMRCC